MAARRGTTPQERAQTADADIRALLADGNTRAALHRARNCLEAEAAHLARSDPARAALLMASLAGSLTALASTLLESQPLRPPGYRGGPPSASHLLAAYEAAKTQTLQQPQARR